MMLKLQGGRVSEKFNFIPKIHHLTISQIESTTPNIYIIPFENFKVLPRFRIRCYYEYYLHTEAIAVLN